jgi:hypothetical protein
LAAYSRSPHLLPLLCRYLGGGASATRRPGRPGVLPPIRARRRRPCPPALPPWHRPSCRHHHSLPRPRLDAGRDHGRCRRCHRPDQSTSPCPDCGHRHWPAGRLAGGLAGRPSDGVRSGAPEHAPEPPRANVRTDPSVAPGPPRSLRPARRHPACRAPIPRPRKRSDRSSRPIPRRYFLFLFLRERGCGFGAGVPPPLDDLAAPAPLRVLGRCWPDFCWPELC